MPAAESIVDLLHDTSLSDDKDDVDSLPSLSTEDIYSEADSDAQAEWERSLEQLQLILTMMIVPWMGKFFGRKFAYWSRTTSKPALNLKTDKTFDRLDEIHDVVPQRRRPMDQQEGLQRCGSSGSGRDAIDGLKQAAEVPVSSMADQRTRFLDLLR